MAVKFRVEKYSLYWRSETLDVVKHSLCFRCLGRKAKAKLDAE